MVVLAHVTLSPHLSSHSFLINNQIAKTFPKDTLKPYPTFSPISSCLTFNQTPYVQSKNENTSTSFSDVNGKKKKRVFLLDVNPLCYNGSKPSLESFSHWASLFFSQVSLTDPVIAVIDGERGDDYRKQLLPSYKAHRTKLPRSTAAQRFPKGPVSRSHQVVIDILRKLNVPVVKIEGQEADDVMATLADQVLQRGQRVVIASPDKDFKQLISQDVQIVMPIPEFGRWSFYTLKHYIAQYGCDPSSDLSLRCIMGDDTDGVPGIQHVVPAFGRKTALKLIKKYGSLENLLNAAAVRTVGRQYAQDALTKHADYLRRNYQVLALRRDLDVHLQEEWLLERETGNDPVVLRHLNISFDAETWLERNTVYAYERQIERLKRKDIVKTMK